MTDSNAIVSANYKVQKPYPPNNVSAGCSVGSSVQISWSEHPSSGVTQYQIWRSIHPDPAELISTKNRGTTSHTDNLYVVTDGYTDDLAKYDVRSVYTAQSPTTYSDPVWHSVFVQANARRAEDAFLSFQTNDPPIAKGITVYPNPFNPSTIFRFGLPVSVFVTLKVYDLLGREVAVLVESFQSEGYHTVEWNADNLPSGVYLYRLNAGKVVQSGRIMLVK